jgi:leader peptidase (prepilin peptidase)/N-methyltransferase
MIRILGTTFVGLLGLAFGSFLNVCLSRWPAGESIVHPRSHCRNCAHTLSWWENIPLLSWLILRGRCRNCRDWIGWRYPLVELSMGVLYVNAISLFEVQTYIGAPQTLLIVSVMNTIGVMIFSWILVALAVLDFENLWLPDWITFPGIGLGFLFALGKAALGVVSPMNGSYTSIGHPPGPLVIGALIMVPLAILAAASLILLIRWLYKLIRQQEGIGLGDAKLMALLAAWLGLPGALLAFVIGAVLGAISALVLLAVPSARTNPQSWATSKLPLGTFLCIGGVVSSLWGQPIFASYMHWAGF